MFKKIDILTLAVFAVIVLFQLQASALEDSMEDEITRIAKNLKVDIDKVGISVRDTADGREIASINGDKLYNPASNIKLLTSYCALKDLGVNYKWNLKVLGTTKIENGAVCGDVYIKGDGDPYLVSENLWMLAKELHNIGLNEIKGNLFIDSSAFDGKDSDREFKSDYDRSFTAYTSAVSLNFNSVTINIHPEKAGSSPKVVVDPDIDYFEVVNDARTVAGKKEASPKISISAKKDKTAITVYGKWAESGMKKHYRKVFHPELYFASAFLKFYKDMGGKFAGKIALAAAPENAREILNFPSKPLSRNIYGLNKYSNNFIADQIAITLGKEKFGLPARFENGIAAINRCFDDSVGRVKGNVIGTASGLARDTRISASQLTKILETANRDFRVSPEFITSLGIYGDDGTVKGRNLPEELRGAVRVKTGNLEGVDALSGYIKTKNSKLLAFSIVANGYKPAQRHNYRLLQDKLIYAVFNLP